ncbi:hypothetical protein L5515_002968 [Caenorhabditis briggsae]|uniref:Uncharacterized protein n=1 Tax=Caenorhabditis briggsae TaxID=6238 RepID=A0AAE9EFT6_CAEBR|nr:hypothetical protein L5515_002968 [Caenorhabditis briggsae]
MNIRVNASTKNSSLFSLCGVCYRTYSDSNRKKTPLILAHLHVFDSPRGNNLGEKLEIGAAKMAIENGIRACKFIDTTNEFFLEKAKKSKMMDVVESNGTPLVFDQNVYSPASNYGAYQLIF